MASPEKTRNLKVFCYCVISKKQKKYKYKLCNNGNVAVLAKKK